MKTYNLKSKRVFVTGAASGIGYQLALAFAREGANIIAIDLAADSLEKIKLEVEGLGVQCRTEVLNVTDTAAYTALFETLEADNQLPDVLLGNAGISIVKSWFDTGVDDWERQFEVNVRGVIVGSDLFVRYCLKHDIEGHLVNTASSVAIGALPYMASYAASKAAVYAATEALACELVDTKIRVSILCPGAINTPITQHEENVKFTKEQYEAVKKSYASATDPAVVAAATVAGVKKNKPVILVGSGARGLDICRRFLTPHAFRNQLIKAARNLRLL